MKKNYAATLANLDEVYSDIGNFCRENGVDGASAYALNLCIDEIFTNAVMHGYKCDPSKNIEIELKMSGGFVAATVCDEAPAFNPLTDASKPDTASSVESREVGGLGIFFILKTMDSVSYRRRNGRNEISMTKKIGK